MEDFTRELENGIADLQIKYKISYEEAIDKGIEYLEELKELRLMSKGVIKND